MCGLAGWFTLDRQDLGLEHLQAMAEAIDHRGPDGEGYWLDDQVALAHKRLSIIDIENGQQPMFSSCKRVVISFNGEVYNHDQIRRELQREGVVFKTQSDTEVIANLFAHKGLKGMSSARGMFAIAVWHLASKTGYLLRDFNGIKPLFFSLRSNGGLYFASEAKAIIRNRGIPSSRSLFKGIDQLKPGHALIWKNGKTSTTELSFDSSSYSYPSTLDALKDSIGHHLVADTNVSAYLSGGIDSSAIVGLTKRFFNKSLQTYTLNVGDDPNEALYAKNSAEILGVNNTQLEIPGSNTTMHNIIWHLETPKVNSWQVFQLCKQVSNSEKVVLSGLGSDELFYGYNLYSILNKVHSNRTLLSLANPISTLIELSTRKHLKKSWGELYRLILLAKNHQNPSFLYGIIRNIWDLPSMRAEIYGERMLEAELIPQFDWLADQWPDDKSPLRAARTFEYSHKLINDLLWQEDRCSMAHGLESRVPFVDCPLIQHAIALPEINKHGVFEKKYALKHALSNNIPSQILNRKKSGFQVDAASFFKASLTDLADRYLSENYVNSKGLFNYNFIATTLKRRNYKYNRWHFFMLYLMIGAHVWLELFEGTPNANKARL